MEKKLSIEMLAPYLPYALKVSKIHTMHAHNGIGNIFQIIDAANKGLDQYKPYLRPLSQLTQEIEHNGERFVPAYKINHFKKSTGLYPKGVYPTITGLCDRHINEDLTTYGGGSWEGGLESDIDTFQFYKLYQKLIEWHFDVFGLIEQGLALPIKD